MMREEINGHSRSLLEVCGADIQNGLIELLELSIPSNLFLKHHEILVPRKDAD